MKPVIQTQVGDHGNCFSACLASILELPIEDVPNFFEAQIIDGAAGWWAALRDWLWTRGYGVIVLNDPCGRLSQSLPGLLIVSGESPRGRMHATIWESGSLVHDPHPEGGGIHSPLDISLLYPLDPARLVFTGEGL